MADLVESSRVLHAKYASVADKGGPVSGIDTIRAEATLIRSSAELIGARREAKERLMRQEEEIARKRDQLGSFELDRENLERKYAGERERLQFELRRAEAAVEDQYGAHAPVGESDNFLDLLATTSGKLTYLRRDAQISSGALIHAVEEQGGDFEAVVDIDARQIGLVQDAEETVLLKFDAYPHFEHGPMNGAVTEISSTVDAEGIYAMRVRVDPASNDFELSSGMTGTASLVVERRSMLGHLFHQLLGAVDELE